MSVGKSDKRTPAKHRMLDKHLGCILGVAPYAAKKLKEPYTGHLIIDLTAGDGESDKINQWNKDSSPIIIAYLKISIVGLGFMKRHLQIASDY
jgi:hypothetical protein